MSGWSWARFGTFLVILAAACAALSGGALAWPSREAGHLVEFPVATNLFLRFQAFHFMGPPVVAMAICYRDPDFLDGPKLMAALLTDTSALLLLAGGVRDALDVWVFCLWNLGCGTCYGIGIPLAAWLTPDRTRKPVYMTSTAAILGGTLLGTMAWSETVPGAVARAAREAASGTPYCVMPGPDRDRLKGIHFVTFAGQDEFAPIGIDVIVDRGGRQSLMRWSFPEGRLLPASGNELSHAHFDYCTPTPGGNLPWHRGS